MNYARIVIAAVVAWLVDSVYGFAVYGKGLESEFLRYPGVFRSMDGVMAYFPVMLAGGLIGMLALAYIFAKGYERGSGLQQGLRFGLVLAVFELGFFSMGLYATLNIGRKIAVEMAAAGIVEALVIGAVLGLVYKPSGIAVSTARV